MQRGSRPPSLFLPTFFVCKFSRQGSTEVFLNIYHVHKEFVQELYGRGVHREEQQEGCPGHSGAAGRLAGHPGGQVDRQQFYLVRPGRKGQPPGL